MKNPSKLISAALSFSAALLMAASLPAQAQHTGMAHGTEKAASTADSASTLAYRKSSEQMMKDMHAAYSGDADQDFASQMLAHHLGAVSMAEVELEFGKDPEMRKLARDIIKAQKQEIALMKKWQAKKGVK